MIIKDRGIFLEDDQGIEIIPAPTASDYVPKPGEFTFKIKCRSRGLCRNWQKKHVKKCIYCKHNYFHHISSVDNLDPIVPGIRVLP